MARIKLGQQKELRIGSLEPKRDWGFAGDYVKAMWQMVQQETPGDFVIATGKTHSVRELCELAFKLVDLDYEQFVVTDPAFIRPAEVDLLVGDSNKAKEILSWQPTVEFKELIEMMVEADLKLAHSQGS